jgi:2-C-methyl-D-erythritol 4-phosphate cytidylyltransferase
MLAAILAAAGRGSRLGGEVAKGLRELAGRPLYAYSLEPLCALPQLAGVWLVVPQAAVDQVACAVQAARSTGVQVHVVAGGEERQDSVALALREDSAKRTPRAGPRCCSSLCLCPTLSVLRRCRPGPWSSHCRSTRYGHRQMGRGPRGGSLRVPKNCACPLPHSLRTATWLAQTPQVARADWLRDAIARAQELRLSFTDEASLLEYFGYRVHVVRGEERNRKLTTPEDWAWAEWAVTQMQLEQPK